MRPCCSKAVSDVEALILCGPPHPACPSHTHRPHQGIANVRPLALLPEPITEPRLLAHLNIHRHDRLAGILHEYDHAA